MKSVTTDIIESTAEDLRLNVVHIPPTEEPELFDETFARRASKTLVELFTYLKKAPPSQRCRT